MHWLLIEMEKVPQGELSLRRLCWLSNKHWETGNLGTHPTRFCDATWPVLTGKIQEGVTVMWSKLGWHFWIYRSYGTDVTKYYIVVHDQMCAANVRSPGPKELRAQSRTTISGRVLLGIGFFGLDAGIPAEFSVWDDELELSSDDSELVDIASESESSSGVELLSSVLLRSSNTPRPRSYHEAMWKNGRDVSEILRRTISITCVSVSSIHSMFRLLGSASNLCARESLDSFSLGKNACTRERTEGLGVTVGKSLYWSMAYVLLEDWSALCFLTRNQEEQLPHPSCRCYSVFRVNFLIKNISIMMELGRLLHTNSFLLLVLILDIQDATRRHRDLEKEKVLKIGKEKGLREARPTARTDELPWSPKTNSASSANCGISSLICQELFNPHSNYLFRGKEWWSPSFLEGTVLKQRTRGLTRWKEPPHIPGIGPLQPLSHGTLEQIDHETFLWGWTLQPKWSYADLTVSTKIYRWSLIRLVWVSPLAFA